MCFSHNRNMKYVDPVIKYISFKSIHYPINIYTILSSTILSNFDSIFL